MKNLTTICFLAPVFLTASAFAQSPATPNTKGLTRADYYSYLDTIHATGVPGVKVQIELERGGRRNLVRPTETLYTGDKIRFLITTNFYARLVVTNAERGAGEPVLLLPMEGDDDQVTAGKVYTTPAFQFDENPGIESVVLLLSAADESSAAGIECDQAARSKGLWRSKGHRVIAKAQNRARFRSKGLVRVDNALDAMVLGAEDQIFAEPTAIQLPLKHLARP